MTSVDLIEWRRLGRELRVMVIDAYGRLIRSSEAWRFLVENPECFDYASWPEDMPADPPAELVAAYMDVA